MHGVGKPPPPTDTGFASSVSFIEATEHALRNRNTATATRIFMGKPLLGLRSSYYPQKSKAYYWGQAVCGMHGVGKPPPPSKVTGFASGVGVSFIETTEHALRNRNTATATRILMDKTLPCQSSIIGDKQRAECMASANHHRPQKPLVSFPARV
jgi:hypothetical protein